MLRRSISTAALAVAATLAIAGYAAAKPGDILVGTDGDGNSLVRIARGTHAVTTVAEIGDGLAGMAFAADGSIFIGDYFDAAVYRVNPRTGTFASFIVDPLIGNPYDIDRGPDGLMYVANDDASGLASFNPRTKQIRTLATGADYDNLTDLTIRHSDGTIFATSDDGNLISYNIRTKAKRVVSEDPQLGAPHGVTLTPDGRLYVNDGESGGAIFRVDIKTGALTPVASGDLLGSTCSYELETDLSGHILSATLCEDRVVSVNPKTGAQSLVAQGTSANDGDFLSPEGLAVEPPRCGGKLATIVGSTGKDVLTGSRFGDVIAALGGRDKIKGAGGRDVVCGGGGRDRLIGGKGKDRLNGQAGRDACVGGPGADKLKSC